MHKIRPFGPAETGRIDRTAPAGLDFVEAFALVPTPLMIMDRDLVIVFANAAYLAVTGCTLSEIQGRYVFQAFPEADERMNLFKSAFEQALAGEANVLTTEPFAIPVEGGGMREIIWTCTHLPLRGADGEIAFVMQNALDVTAKHENERENRVLMRELDHRVKNSLATVQAVTRMSLVETKPVRVARDDLLGRLRAMSEAQNLLINRRTEGSSVKDVMTGALTPFGFDPGDTANRFRLDGPQVRLTAKQTQALAMAVHELATNAAKYGALSTDEGTVHVTWTFEEQDRSHLQLVWREAGGPPVKTPTGHGFGTTMLTRVLAQEINGEISLEYNQDGLVCTMEGWLEDRN